MNDERYFAMPCPECAGWPRKYPLAGAAIRRSRGHAAELPLLKTPGAFHSLPYLPHTRVKRQQITTARTGGSPYHLCRHASRAARANRKYPPHEAASLVRCAASPDSVLAHKAAIDSGFFADGLGLPDLYTNSFVAD